MTDQEIPCPPDSIEVAGALDLLAKARHAIESIQCIRSQLDQDVDLLQRRAESEERALHLCETLETVLHLTVQAEIGLHRAAAMLTVVSAEAEAENGRFVLGLADTRLHRLPKAASQETERTGD